MGPQMSRSATTRSNKKNRARHKHRGNAESLVGRVALHRPSEPATTTNSDTAECYDGIEAVCSVPATTRRNQDISSQACRARGQVPRQSRTGTFGSHRSWQCCRACSESSRSRFALMRRSRSHPQRAANCCEVVRRPPTNHRVLCFRKAQRDCMNAAIPSGRRPTPPRTLSARHWNTVKMPGALTSGGTDHPPSRTEHAERSMPPLGTARR